MCELQERNSEPWNLRFFILWSKHAFPLLWKETFFSSQAVTISALAFRGRSYLPVLFSVQTSLRSQYKRMRSQCLCSRDRLKRGTQGELSLNINSVLELLLYQRMKRHIQISSLSLFTEILETDKHVSHIKIYRKQYTLKLVFK